MRRAVFVVPGDLATPTGGYGYARKILPLLAGSIGMSLCNVQGGFPFPSQSELEAAAAALKAADGPDCALLIDGLCFGVLPGALLAELSAPIAVLLHHPLGLEEGLAPEQKEMLLQSEADALKFARRVVVTSEATAAEVSRLFGVKPSAMTVAEPGVLRGRKAEGAAPGEPLHIVSVGTITPRKGFDVLAEALGAIKDLEWRATVAGALDAAPATAADLRQRIAAHGLEGRIALRGTLDERAVSALYSSGDVFALASRYEGYGMAFAEAIAHGLPVVASGDGAVRDTVPDACGIYCATGDADAFAAALRRMLTDRDFRGGKAEGAWRRGQTLPTWDATAGIIAAALGNL